MENSSGPFNTVMIRRGNKVARGIPARRLVAYIQEKKILRTDEISGDGRKWMRADQLRHLAAYFPNEPLAKVMPVIPSIFPQDRVARPEAFSEHASSDEISPALSPHPPGVENELARLAKMLEDINR